MRRQKAGWILAMVPVLCLCGCISHAVYFPQREVRHTPGELNLEYEDIRFETSDGVRLSGWLVPARNPRGTVLFCHGNGGNVEDCLDSIRIGHRLGLTMFVFDYRGYGGSQGTPTEQGTYTDADAAWDYLVVNRKVPPGDIVIWGRSLGGAVAARTAAHHPAGILIIESTFVSIRELARDRFSWVPSWVLDGYVYDTLDELRRVDIPVLVIHSPDDEIIPFRHGRALYDSLKGPRSFVEIQGSHNRGYLESTEVYESGIDAFISRFLAAKESASP
ncbi:MAG TPA: alpha/beta hydrolase [Deltaproteobacteria bacterium]|nr:alpha/beta hydrolase [Deltaproteobacteria bacterium]